MEKTSDLSNRIEAITSDPEIDDFFLVISSKTESHLEAKTVGQDIISAMARIIVGKEGGLSTINRMQLAIFKAKDLAKRMLEEKFGALH